MGERKGVNKYYPPDFDPGRGGLNRYHGTHALRERAKKIHMGIIIIRFEMPYNIWCDGCHNHIGMGVRYNAEKKKVGMYYTTPIYQFRMKCHLCDNYFEIKTDPANLDYVIVSGARRQENRWDASENEQIVTDEKAVIRKLAADSMFRLEHGVNDKDKSEEIKSALENLTDFQESRWKDDFASNSALRQRMRKTRKEVEDQRKRDLKLNLDTPLLPPSEEDSCIAAIHFAQAHCTKTVEELRNEINSESVFPNSKSVVISKKALAKRSLGNILGSKKHTFTSFQSKVSPRNLGVRPKKSNQNDDDSKKLDNSTIRRVDEKEIPSENIKVSKTEHPDEGESCRSANLDSAQSDVHLNMSDKLKISTIVTYDSTSSDSDLPCD